MGTDLEEVGDRTGGDAIFSALMEVEKIAVSSWQTRGDEPENPDQDETDYFVAMNLRSKVTCLRDAYNNCGLNELADDLDGFDADGRTLDAVLRLQRYHCPLARVRAADKTSGVVWASAVARELQGSLAGLAAHCAADYYYDAEGNYQTEDAILAGLINGVRDFANACGLADVANQFSAVVVKPYTAPAVRDRLKIVVLPACQDELASWCQAQGIDVPAAGGSTAAGHVAVARGMPAGKKWKIGDACLTLTDLRGKKAKSYKVTALCCQEALRFLVTKGAFSQEHAVHKTDLCVAVRKTRGLKGVECKPIQFFREGPKKKTRLMPFATILENDGRGMYWLDI